MAAKQGNKKNVQVANGCLEAADERDGCCVFAYSAGMLLGYADAFDGMWCCLLISSYVLSRRPLRLAAGLMINLAKFTFTRQDDAAEYRGKLSNLEWANVRLLAEMRLGLIVTAMLLLLFQPPGEARLAPFLILSTYAVFSVALLRRAVQRTADIALNSLHWVDGVAYGLIVALTGVLQSRFTVFLLFPLIAASFDRCMRSSLGLAVICMVWLVGIALGQEILRPPFNLEDLSLGPVVAMIVMGLVITRWTLLEVSAGHRLAFFNELNRLFSVRKGLDQAVYELAEMLRAYHGSDACVIVMNDTKSGGWFLYEVDAVTGRKLPHGERIDATLAQPLLALSSDCVAMFGARRLSLPSRVCVVKDLSDLSPRPANRTELAGVATLLETPSFVSLPVRSRTQTIGQVYLLSQYLRYSDNDLRFLERAMSQAGLMLENMQLVERLTLEVADEERKKISRDLHDGTIQPYIGLKLGLEALHRKVADNALVSGEVDDLIKLASDSINQLRHYVGNLRCKEQPHNPRRSSLLAAVQRHADKFSEYYGIQVSVVADGDVSVSVPLLEEVIYIVREALSNIRRHTSVCRASINVRRQDNYLVLEFVNESPARNSTPSDAFVPQSIAERTRELGGDVAIERTPHGEVLVVTKIPV